MFIGHHGVAFAAKKAAPQVSLGLLFLATMWIDLVWPVFLLLGIEAVEIKPGITKVTPFLGLLLPLWTWWTDRHRLLRS